MKQSNFKYLITILLTSFDICILFHVEIVFKMKNIKTFTILYVF